MLYLSEFGLATAHRGKRARLLIALAAALAADSASAAILGIRASATTTVQELIAGAPASVNADSAEYPAEGVTLPLEVSASVTTTDLEGALTAYGQGFGQFLDPTRLDEPNPQELAVEVGCYSNAEQVTYQVESRVTETRTVRFSRRELDLSPSESSTEVNSRVFLSGAALVWATSDAATQESLDVELRLSVTRDEETAPLFEATLTITGVDGAARATGGLSFRKVSLAELAALGVDQATIDVLQELEDSQRMSLLVIGPQEHDYSYDAAADETFTLTARLETRVRNAPSGTGIAATLGRPFSGLPEIVEPALPGVNGILLESAINQVVAQGAAPSEPDVRPWARLCGAMGWIPLSLLCGMRFAARRRRRRYG